PSYGPPVAPMPPEPYTPPPRRRWPWLVSLGSAFLVLVLGGGAFAAYQSLNGGGTAPEKVIPADAFAFAKLDLNPSASQKLAAIRFFSHLPGVGRSFNSSTDPRESFFNALASDGELPAGLSYERDVKPWLGDRLAIAERPALVSTDPPEVLIAVKSSDEAKAKAGIARLTAEYGDEIGVGFRSGYAILAESQDVVDRAISDDAKGDLAGSADFNDDMGKLGDPGVASGWLDDSAATKLAASADPLLSSGAFAGLSGQSSGRAAFVLRLTPTAADMVIKSFGGPPAAATARPGDFPTLGDLPAGTAVAVEAGGLSRKIDDGWSAALQALGGLSGGLTGGSSSGGGDSDPAALIKQYEREFGISLPGDLKTVLGDDLLFSLDSAGLPDSPRIAVRTATDPGAATRVLDKLKAALAAHGEPFPVSVQSAADGLVVSNDPDYGRSIARLAGAKLSSQDDFKATMPEESTGAGSAYVNLNAIVAQLKKAGASADDLGALTAFRAIGLTSTVTGGTSTITIRILAN
ncbi:MAG: hypothetical protein JWO63_290, partial [Frankiales bacterium]|nr:hypothetical protein [Frankiales bacterium]